MQFTPHHPLIAPFITGVVVQKFIIISIAEKNIMLPPNTATRFSLLKIITAGDALLVIGIVAISIFSLRSIAASKKAGQTVRIEVAGSLKHQFSLSQHQEIAVTGPRGKTIIQIDSGSVQVTYSDCPDQICVKTGRIRHAGEMIVCVPNQVVVKIEGERKQPLDVITE
ncbi:MAG: NusG domain II-containing protein [candidate division KSB1 bacterium]|nr:NusG domain II-containing protein [candidate division KSB1 bacterium]